MTVSCPKCGSAEPGRTASGGSVRAAPMTAFGVVLSTESSADHTGQILNLADLQDQRHGDVDADQHRPATDQLNQTGDLAVVPDGRQPEYEHRGRHAGDQRGDAQPAERPPDL